MAKKFKNAWLAILVFSLIITNMAFPVNSARANAEETKEFTLYYYFEAENADSVLYLNIWNHSGITFGTDAKTDNAFEWAHEQGILQPVPDNTNWYSIPIAIIGTNADGFTIYNTNSTDDSKLIEYDNEWNHGEDYAIMTGGSQNAYAVKNGKLYTDLKEAGLTINTGSGDNNDHDTPSPASPLDRLKELVSSLPEDYATLGFAEDSIKAVADAFTSANALIEENSQDASKIEEAYNALSLAIDNLTLSSELFIKKIQNYDENSIRGMDVSSYLSIMRTFEQVRKNMQAAGASQDEIKSVGFKDWKGNVLDEQGFFNLLAESGVNYIRIRVWNDPYNANGKGYGGGNNDIDTAVEMGKYITNAGMKVLIDFHLSDFWADPGKQQAPKAWKNYTVNEKAEAVSNFITDSLTKLITENKINVAMVQVGNETNSGVCGEKDWAAMNQIFDAGCKAVHTFPGVLAAIHFTNPEKEGLLVSFADNLADYDGDGDGTKEGVSYDVLASSYYPNSHGTMENITKVLTDVAKKYDKYVIVAETAWANSNNDGDGFGDSAYNTGDYVDYNITLQGQANAVRDVANAVSAIDVTLKNGKKAALGFFYWEPAWIPVQSLYAEDGSLKADSKKIAEENKALWEEFGSGWASSYAAEYDPDDAGLWYGGSSMDNQAVFDFNGRPLPVLDVFNANCLKYGTKGTQVKPDGYTAETVEIKVQETVDNSLPETIKILYNDFSEKQEQVNWNQEDIQKVNTAAAASTIGSYTIHGVLANDASFAVEITVTINPINLLADPGFEQEPSAWEITGEGAGIKSEQDKKSGIMCLHFWSGSDFTFSASTTTTVTQAGYYNASIYMQGLAQAGTREGESLKLVAATSDGKQYSSENMMLTGWINWQLAEVNDIYISPAMIKDGKNTITLSVEATLNAEAWGTIDDAVLYLNKEEKEPTPSEPENKPSNGSGTVNNGSNSSSSNSNSSTSQGTQTVTKPEPDTSKDTNTDTKKDPENTPNDNNTDNGTDDKNTDDKNTDDKNTNNNTSTGNENTNSKDDKKENNKNKDKDKNNKKNNKKDSKKTTTIKLNKNMTLSKTKASITKGKKIQIQLPKSLSGKVSFLSKNKKIATVSKKGLITAKKKGKVKIIIKKGKKKTVFTLTVK